MGLTFGILCKNRKLDGEKQIGTFVYVLGIKKNEKERLFCEDQKRDIN